MTRTRLQKDVDEAAYKALKKTIPGIIDSLKGVFQKGGTAKQVERKFSGKKHRMNLTVNATICAAYHMESHPETYQENRQ